MKIELSASHVRRCPAGCTAKAPVSHRPDRKARHVKARTVEHQSKDREFERPTIDGGNVAVSRDRGVVRPDFLRHHLRRDGCDGENLGPDIAITNLKVC